MSDFWEVAVGDLRRLLTKILDQGRWDCINSNNPSCFELPQHGRIGINNRAVGRVVAHECANQHGRIAVNGLATTPLIARLVGTIVIVVIVIVIVVVVVLAVLSLDVANQVLERTSLFRFVLLRQGLLYLCNINVNVLIKRQNDFGQIQLLITERQGAGSISH
jgi:hypothetical protein